MGAGCADSPTVPPLRIVHDVRVEKAKVDADLLKSCGTSRDGLPADGADTPRNWAAYANRLSQIVDCYEFKQDKTRGEVDGVTP